MAASSSSSSNVTPTPILDEMFAVSGETQIPVVMKTYFEQRVLEEKAFKEETNGKIPGVKASLTMVCKAIREMESKSDKEAWTDSINGFKAEKARLELKLSRLTQLEKEAYEGVEELKVSSAIMDLCDDDED